MVHELNQGLTELKDDRDYTKEFILNRYRKHKQKLIDEIHKLEA